MKALQYSYILTLLMSILSCNSHQKPATKNLNNEDFANEMVDFMAFKANPVFKGTGTNTWDKQIRERGYIMFEEGIYKMWYTGYNGDDTVTKYLGYATSENGTSTYNTKPEQSD